MSEKKHTLTGSIYVVKEQGVQLSHLSTPPVPYDGKEFLANLK